MKFLNDLYLDKNRFLVSNLNSLELSDDETEFFRLIPTPDKVLFRNLESD